VSRICLDTSAYSRFMTAEPRVVEIVDGASWVGMPAIVLGELRTGFMLGKRRQANERSLQAFLRHPVVEVLAIDEVAAGIYAELVVALRVSGTPLPTNDLWIAAVAVREGATIVTYDRHFQLIQRAGVDLL